MKKVFKVFGWAFLIFIVGSSGFAFFQYKTNPELRAMLEHDESKLFYLPVKQVDDLSRFEYEEIELQVSDSVKIYNYYFKSQADTVFGKIFLLHDEGGNASYSHEYFGPLLKAGFNVYVVDWRSYGKSEGRPDYMNVLSDSQKSFEDFKARTQSDSLKTIVYGLSIGGQLAVKIALDNPKQINALVLDASILSAQQMAIDYAPIIYFQEKARKNTSQYNQEYIAFRDIQKIENLPKLIIQSKIDEKVAFEHGDTLFKAALEPKTFWETDTKHLKTLKEYPNEAIEKIKALIQ